MSGDDGFDLALIRAVFELAADKGWGSVTVAAAARAAGLDLARARLRFPGRGKVLLRFGQIADAAALTGVVSDGPVRDRLFDMLMRRLDVLQTHRAGVRALLRQLPGDPALALLLLGASKRSLGWLLEAAGVGAAGWRGALRVRGLLAVWLYTVRAWEKDDSADLSATMRALDEALKRAEQAAPWLAGGDSDSPPPAAVETAPPATEPPA